MYADVSAPDPRMDVMFNGGSVAVNQRGANSIQMLDRLMLRNEPAHPRLVPYYLPTPQPDTSEDDDDGALSEGEEG
jgi:hypothetical protein